MHGHGQNVSRAAYAMHQTPRGGPVNIIARYISNKWYKDDISIILEF
jgi:hypothetical protein